MDYIGKRISIKKKEDELSVVILPLAEKRKNNLLLVWLLLWSLSGLVILSQFFVISDVNTKIAVLVWLAFWAYFEYKIVNAYRWRKSGKEKIKIRENKFLYKRDISGKGAVKTYEIDFIKNVRLVENKDESFMESLNNSYWVIAGEKLVFDYSGKEIRFGLQLEDTDAKALLKLLQNQIKK